MTTAMAFTYFRERVKFAILEVGMGGRLDATNVVRQDVSVITSIGFDHQQYLGNTLEQIAAEKAGIIKILRAGRHRARGGVRCDPGTCRQTPLRDQASPERGSSAGQRLFRFRSDNADTAVPQPPAFTPGSPSTRQRRRCHPRCRVSEAFSRTDRAWREHCGLAWPDGTDSRNSVVYSGRCPQRHGDVGAL